MRAKSKRLKVIEERLNHLQAPKAQADEDPLEVEEFVREAEEDAKNGLFDDEPDFPTALDQLKQAIAGKTFRKMMPSEEFPEGYPDDVKRAVFWIITMQIRVCSGIPPTSEAEMRELSAWFKRNRGYLIKELQNSKKPLRLPTGRDLDLEAMERRLRMGYWMPEISWIAVELRYLRYRFGELTPVLIEDVSWMLGDSCNGK